MADHTCMRCGYNSQFSSNLKSHLQRKTPCPAIFSDAPASSLLHDLEEANRKRFESICEYCDKKLASPSTKWAHKKICKQRPQEAPAEETEDVPASDIIRHQQQQIEALTKLLTLQAAAGPSNIINNTNNISVGNNNSIMHNNFGKESLDHITDEFKVLCILGRTAGVRNMIKQIHLHPDHPENNNVRIKSHKSNLMEQFSDGTWHPCDKNNTLDTMIRNGFRVIHRHYVSIRDSHPDMKDEQEEFMHFHQQMLGACNRYYQLRRDLYCMIYENNFYLLESSTPQTGE